MILLLVFPLGAAAQPLSEISQRLVIGGQLSGRFEQEKMLAYLSRPLVSSGNFYLDTDEGLRWTVRSPIVSEMTVNASGVRLDGRKIRDFGAGELIAELMQVFMSGDVGRLEHTFSVTGESQELGWHLTLVPRSSFLQSVLESVDVSGAKFLEEVTIKEVSGTSTSIRFYEIGRLPAHPNTRHEDSS